MPDPRDVGAETVGLRVLSVLVDDRSAVGAAGTAAAAGQPRRAGWPAGEASAPPGPGRDLLRCPWWHRLGALPAEFPPAKTVYGIFRRWVRAGVWARLHDALRDRARVRAGRSPLPTAAVIDSASVRAADTVPA